MGETAMAFKAVTLLLATSLSVNALRLHSQTALTEDHLRANDTAQGSSSIRCLGNGLLKGKWFLCKQGGQPDWKCLNQYVKKFAIVGTYYSAKQDCLPQAPH